MSDDTRVPGFTADEGERPQHQPRHRRDDVAVDGEPDLSEFGENPDTELAG